VLISPYALGPVVESKHGIAVRLTKQQIEDSPAIESDQPVSRQFEESYFGYYGWPGYWAGPYCWGYYPYLERDREKWPTSNSEGDTRSGHLRSSRDATGHNIQASDGEIGHLEDFILDDETWAIRYLIVSTRNWWPGKKILLSPQWIERISWSESKIFVNLSREAIKQAPEYEEDSMPDRAYEVRLYQHFQRPGYWLADPGAPAEAAATIGGSE
jgi:hypothetical protein